MGLVACRKFKEPVGNQILVIPTILSNLIDWATSFQYKNINIYILYLYKISGDFVYVNTPVSYTLRETKS